MKTVFNMNLAQCAFSALPATIVAFLFQQKHNDNIYWNLLATVVFFCLLTTTQWWAVRKNQPHWEEFQDLMTKLDNYSGVIDKQMKKTAYKAKLQCTTQRFLILNTCTMLGLWTLALYVFLPA